MVLFQTTADRRWLQPPFVPQRDVNLIADEQAGLPLPVQQQIRSAAIDLFSSGCKAPLITDPGDELMLEMMQVCLGESVPTEYAPMMREQLGFDSSPLEKNSLSSRAATPTSNIENTRPVVIVGAGVSGMALAVRLLQQRLPFVILERNPQVGGTWWENRYPGCAVDTPNHAYSFSYGQRYPWSRYFSPRAELLDYMQQCAREFGLIDHIRFRHEVLGGRWQASDSTTDGGFWQLQVRGADGREQQIEALAVVSAIGQLSLPSIPAIHGAADFAGEIFHSARWPQQLDLTGKRVAIVGTGASCMQIAPAIADSVASLTIYQRSVQWVREIPRFHDEISTGARWLLENVPLYARWMRFTLFWRYGDGLLRTLKKDPDWEYPQRSLNRANDRHRQQMTAHIQAKLADRPDLLRNCLPDYPPYGKRILLDNHWYDTLLKPQVSLVSNPIERIDAGGVRSTDGSRIEADVIVLATGFRVGLMAARLNLTGVDDTRLANLWANDDPTAYLGITVPGFPNLFCMQGPGTGLGHGGSAIFQAECQANYISGCIDQFLRVDDASIEVRQQVHDDYIIAFDNEHRQMIWSHPGMSTYYRNAAGRVFSVMPWRLVDYWGMTRQPNPADYHLSHKGQKQ